MKTDRNDQTTTTAAKFVGDSKTFLDSTLLNVSNLVGRRKPSSGAVSGLSCIEKTTVMEPYPMDSTQLSDKDYLEVQLSMKQQYIDRLKGQLSETIGQINALEGKYRVLKQAAKRMEERMNWSVSETNKLKSEKTALIQQNCRLVAERDSLAQTVRQLRQSCDSLRSEMLKAKQRHSEYEQVNDELHQQLAYLKLEVVRLSDRESMSLVKLEQTCKELSDLQKLKDKYHTLQGCENELNRTVFTLQHQLQLSKQQLDSTTKQNSMLVKGQLQALTKCDRLERELEEQSQKTRQANARIAQIQEEHSLEKSALQTQLNFFIDTIEQLTKMDSGVSEDRGKRYCTREAMETAMNSSRLFTQLNGSDKENRRMQSNCKRLHKYQSKIRVVQSCEDYEQLHQPNERRIGLIKGVKPSRDCLSIRGVLSTVEQQ